MNIQEIKQAVDNGQKVYWTSNYENPDKIRKYNYEVIKDNLSQYLVKCLNNGHCIGLTNQAGDKLNGDPDEFYIG